MPSTSKFLFYFLLFTFNGFFPFREHFISAGGFSLDGSSLLGSIAHSPSNLLVSKLKAAIGATKFIPNCFKPLTIFTALDETLLVNQTTQSQTVASATGGTLGSDIFEVDHFSYFWQNSLCNETHNLEAQVYFFNLKYGSFLNAQDHPGGVTVINFPISTNGDIPNWKFDVFSKILEKKINEPGDYVKVHAAFTYTWFVNFPYGSIYHTYMKKFTDPSNGKKYIATVIDLPLDPRVNFISNSQFSNTFGKIKKVSEESMADAFVQDNSITSQERHKGICIIDLPA